jgi:hypothetical protein
MPGIYEARQGVTPQFLLQAPADSEDYSECHFLNTKASYPFNLSPFCPGTHRSSNYPQFH